jgi:hypothetical protein
MSAGEVIGINTRSAVARSNLLRGTHGEFRARELVAHGRVRCAYLGIGAGTVPVPRRIGPRGLGQRMGAVVSAAKGSPADQRVFTGDIKCGRRRRITGAG